MQALSQLSYTPGVSEDSVLFKAEPKSIAQVSNVLQGRQHAGA